MNDIVVPIDLTQEEKEILAIFSIRQFMIVLPTVGGGLVFAVWGGIPFMSGTFELAIRIIGFVLSAGIGIALAFVRLEKYEQYLSEYLRTQLEFRRSQKVYYYEE